MELIGFALAGFAAWKMKGWQKWLVIACGVGIIILGLVKLYYPSA